MDLMFVMKKGVGADQSFIFFEVFLRFNIQRKKNHSHFFQSHAIITIKTRCYRYHHHLSIYPISDVTIDPFLCKNKISFMVHEPNY